jgi:NADH:ubiquinone oxidoreductase subunit 3 (subunit A)
MITALLFVIVVIFLGGCFMYLVARIVEESREKKEKENNSK